MANTTKVSQLVPAFCSPNKDPASAGRVRQAFVAHTMFFHEAGAQAVQLDALVKSGVDDLDSLVALLCESYSRAIFETLFSLHFDKLDPRADEQLLDAIAGTYSRELASTVHAAVTERGVTITRTSRPVVHDHAPEAQHDASRGIGTVGQQDVELVAQRRPVAQLDVDEPIQHERPAE